MSQDASQHAQSALDAEMAELEAAAARAADIEQKLDHARRMAEGEIMTCLGPADRHALRTLIGELENYDRAFDKLSDGYGAAVVAMMEARELCALMAESEGPNPEVYMSMARQAMEKLDQVLPEGPKSDLTEGS